MIQNCISELEEDVWIPVPEFEQRNHRAQRRIGHVFLQTFLLSGGGGGGGGNSSDSSGSSGSSGSSAVAAATTVTATAAIYELAVHHDEIICSMIFRKNISV